MLKPLGQFALASEDRLALRRQAEPVEVRHEADAGQTVGFAREVGSRDLILERFTQPSEAQRC